MTPKPRRHRSRCNRESTMTPRERQRSTAKREPVKPWPEIKPWEKLLGKDKPSQRAKGGA